jgi:hypothetical protein
MKNKLFTISLLMAVFMSSCTDSASDEFDDANENAEARYIKTITSSSPGDEPSTATINYDASGKVTNISDGDESSTFVYENNNLTSVTGEGDLFQISQLYQAPYEAYDVGQVLEYDAKGNPTKIRLFEENINGVIEEFSASVTYDTAPNSLFHTLKAAGIIDVLDNIRLNLNMQNMPQQIVRAKVLLPVNNPTRVVIKDIRDAVVSTTVTNYTYNSFNYPTSAVATTTEQGNIETTNFTFTYKE